MTPLPRLYKYKRLDEKTVSLIVNRVIYFAGPNQFNDPFDCSLRYDLSGTEAEWRDYFARSLTELRPELAPEEAANMVDAQMREGAFRNTRFLKSISDDALRHQNERLGILSLTADPTNILMWSHYADAHRGCCLEFSTSAPVFKGAVNFRRAEHVKYAVEYPSVRFLDCVGKPDKHVEFTVLTKSDLWEYEEEWRITSLRGPGLYKFASSAEFVGKRWPQSSENALFAAQNGLKMHADMRSPLDPALGGAPAIHGPKRKTHPSPRPAGLCATLSHQRGADRSSWRAILTHRFCHRAINSMSCRSPELFVATG
jgi:hypothetical protein